MKLGSLFDGSGGFPLAGTLFGIEPVWASEIEPYPLKVTAARFPNMKQLGDVTKVKGAKIEPVDIITFGSPCQDLSTAGKQAGIHDGARSSLFFEAIRIIREMREATDGRYPTYAVWENVPGALCCNKGEDFKAVLEAFCNITGRGITIPRPAGGKWKHAGCIVGDGYSIAWRIYDAQFWGVPQRRKRIYLIADFGTERAGEILFECESLSGNSEPGKETRQETAGDAAGSVRRSDQPCGFFGKASGTAGSIGYGFVAPTLKAGQNAHVVYSIEGHVIDRNTVQNGRGWAEAYAHTLNATDRHGVVYPDVARTLIARMDASPCVDRGQEIVVHTYIQPSFGDFHESDFATTLKASDGKRVDPGVIVLYPEKTGCLCANSHPGGFAGQDAYNDMLCVLQNTRKYIVRRLTPLECCRLQGFPDWWCDGVEGSDSAQYRMWGNGIALPCAADVLGRIVKELERNREERR